MSEVSVQKYKDNIVAAKLMMSGTKHEWQFRMEQDSRAIPVRLIQGGETYKSGLKDIPDEIIRAVEKKTGYTVTHEEE